MTRGSGVSSIDFRGTSDKRRSRGRGRLLLSAGVLCLAGGVALTLASGASERARQQEGANNGSGDRVRHTIDLPGKSASSPASEATLARAIPDIRVASVDARNEVDARQAPPGQTPEREPQASAPPLLPTAAAPRPAPPADDAAAATLATEPSMAPPPRSSELSWESYGIRSGDNLAAVFSRAGFTARDVHDVVNADDKASGLTRIFPGDTIELSRDDAGALRGVRYEISDSETLEVTHDGDGFRSEVVKHPPEARTAHASATIRTSLFAAGARAGLDDRLIMELANIFAWDVDFALDIRQGDEFTVVYEELYRNDEKIRTGAILAAEFVNQGNLFRAVRYTSPDGETAYFTPEGRSMRKAFLRTPVNFTRVSSDFNPERYHPVLGVKRPHLGTDYAAPTGTPIKAAGDGRIIHRGRKGGYGHTVIIQHGTRYSTLYAHMSKYRGGQSVGDRVTQGETIGYVGASGLATGPHLHYEFRVDGRHRNPRTVSLPDADPIPKSLRADFTRETAPMLARLEELGTTRIARADPEE